MLKHQVVMFIANVLVGIALNPMNLLAFRISDLYFSLTLLYGGLSMAANMIWSHEVINYVVNGKFNLWNFIIGLAMLAGIIVLLRKQVAVNEPQYLRRMISHHSTALTTSHHIYRLTKDKEVKKLAKDIIETQEREIAQMRHMLARF